MTATNHGLEQCTTCGRYGWHTSAKCPTAAGDPAVALPEGAAAHTDWDRDERGDYRIVWTAVSRVGGTELQLQGNAIQLANGTVVTAGGDGTVCVDRLGPDGTARDCLELSAADARSLAASLTAMADALQRWSTV